MVASKIREEARENLTGKWGKSALLFLIFIGIEILASILMSMFSIIPILGVFFPIAYAILSIPFWYGLFVSFIKIKRGEEVGYVDFFSIGFSNFGKVWSIIGYSLLKYLPYIICIIVGYVLIAMSATFSITSYMLFANRSLYAAAGFGLLGFLGLILVLVSYILLIPKSFSLALVFPILNDHPDKNGKEIVNQSVELMQGHRWNLFYLYLTFIGWAILSIFTLYIGYFFLFPYMIVSFICFYETLVNGKKDTVEIVETKKISEKNETEEVIQEPKVIQEKSSQEDNNPIQSDDEE